MGDLFTGVPSPGQDAVVPRQDNMIALSCQKCALEFHHPILSRRNHSVLDIQRLTQSINIAVGRVRKFLQGGTNASQGTGQPSRDMRAMIGGTQHDETAKIGRASDFEGSASDDTPHAVCDEMHDLMATDGFQLIELVPQRQSD